MRRSLSASTPRTARSRPRAGLCSVALAVAAISASGPAAALSLGAPDLVSYLGQPLLLRVPAILDDPSDGGTPCLRIIREQGADVPSLAVGRIEVERGAEGSFLRVTTSEPIDEPVLRVVLEIGCRQRVRREFTLLLDPPAGVTNIQEATSEPQIEFGTPEVIGVRGQPLLVNVPLSGPLASTLSSSCVRPGRSDSGELPRVLNDARVTLVDRDGGRALRIHTPEAVNDARVRVFVEVGCERPFRREFVVQVDEPRLAATPAQEAAPVVPAPPPKRPAKPVARVQPPPPPPAPPKPVAVVPPPPPPELPVAQQVEVRPIEPARLPPREQPGKTDRLVLAAPEETPSPPGPSARETEVLKRLEELSKEVKTLRAELDAAALRNRELAEKANSASYAWAAAAGSALLLGLAIVFGWRSRPREEVSRSEPDRRGPMTRILGQHVEKAPPAPPAPQMTDGAGPATIAAIAAAHRAHEADTQGASTAIMVTEFRDTTQVIGELYSPYIEKGPTTLPGGPATVPGPQTKTEIALDVDLGQERTTVFSPQTKTEIAVDIDLFERNSQIGRDLQKEYEKLDRDLGAPPPAAPKPQGDADPATLLGGTTMPMTTKLALDLDLDMSTIQQPKKPPEVE